MLRRVVLAHRQLEHSILSAECTTAHVFHPPCFRQAASVAVLFKRQTQISDIDAFPNHVPALGQTSRKTHPPIPLQMKLPPELLELMDSILSSRQTDAEMLHLVRASPELSTLMLETEKVRVMAESTALSQSAHRVLCIVNLAHNLGCKLRQNVYECVAHKFASRKHWSAVLSIVALGQRHTRKTTTRLLNWRALALARTQRYTLLNTILEEFKQCGLSPNRRTFHIVLSAHIHNKDLASAKECLRVMEEANLPPDTSTHALMATSYRTFGADPKVQKQAVASLPSMDHDTALSVVNSLLQTCLSAHDIPTTFQLLSLFDPANLKVILLLTSHHLTLSNHSSISRLDPIHRLSGPLRPNVITFSIFINYHAKLSDLSGATSIYNSMIASGIDPTPATLTAILHACFQAGKGDLAIQLVAEMCTKEKFLLKKLELGPPRNEPPFDFSGLSPTVQIFNSLLRGVLNTHGIQSARTVIRIMRANGVNPNAKTLEIILRRLDKMEQVRPQTILRILRAVCSRSIRPTLRHVYYLMNSILRHEKFLLHGAGWNETAAKLYRPTIQRKYRMSPDARIRLADRFDPMGGLRLPRFLPQHGIGRHMVQSLSMDGVKSDSASIALRIRHNAVARGDMDSAKDVFNTLLLRGMHPNEYHFSALMEGYTRLGNMSAAVDVMKSAERIGLKPGVVMFTILIVGYARQGNPDLSMRMFQQMVSAGVQPDVPSIDAVSSAFFAVGAYTLARKVLISLWNYIQPFPEDLRGASLKELAHRFRALHGNLPTRQLITKERGLELQHHLNGLLDALK